MLASVALVTTITACKSERWETEHEAEPSAPRTHVRIHLLGGDTIALESVVYGPDGGTEPSTELPSDRDYDRTLRMLGLPFHEAPEDLWPPAARRDPSPRAAGALDTSR